MKWTERVAFLIVKNIVRVNCMKRDFKDFNLVTAWGRKLVPSDLLPVNVGGRRKQ